MSESCPARRLPLAAWVIAYLLSAPALPFICLRIARAISTFQCILGVLAGLVVHIGLIPAMAATNGNPLQMLILLLMVTSMYLVVLWQYLAGHAVALWSESAERQWRIAGRFFGGLLGIVFALNVLTFNYLAQGIPQEQLEQKLQYKHPFPQRQTPAAVTEERMEKPKKAPTSAQRRSPEFPELPSP